MDLIILPFHDWKKVETGGLRSRDGHLLTHFRTSPRVAKILFVDRPISLPERMISRRPLRCRTGKEIARSGRAILSRIDEKLLVLDLAAPDLLSPLVLRRDWWDAVFRRRWVIEGIRWAADRAGMIDTERVLMCWSPLATGPFGQLDERLIVFDALDNWCNHPEMNDARGWIRRGYRTACEKADLLTCNNEGTGKFLAQLGGRPQVDRNGVDADRWDPAQWRDQPPPQDLAAIPRPWIGYAGALAKRTDVDLIDRLAQSRPEWSIVLLGPLMDRDWHRRLLGRANIHFLGDKHYDVLPSYVAHFDVGCVFHLLKPVENMDPTKIYEYLACGLPVVSTPVAGSETLTEWVTIAEDAEGFERAIAEFLERRASDSAAFDRNREAVLGAEYSWSAKAERFLDRIENLLKAKTQS